MSDSEEFWSAEEDNTDVTNNLNQPTPGQTNENTNTIQTKDNILTEETQVNSQTNENNDTTQNSTSNTTNYIPVSPLTESPDPTILSSEKVESVVESQDTSIHSDHQLEGNEGAKESMDKSKGEGKNETNEGKDSIDRSEGDKGGADGGDKGGVDGGDKGGADGGDKGGADGGDKIEEVSPPIDPEELERIKSEVLERKETGNKLFRSEDFASALDTYSSGLSICPATHLPKERSILLSNRAVCHLKLGEQQLALTDCSESLLLDPFYIRARLRRAQVYEGLGKLEEALEDYNELLKMDPGNREARTAVPRLTVDVEKQREALKAEAITKLKELGNMVLNPFGISTSDFKFVQDPKTGGYNVSFEKNS